jgi:hypothetical protein
MSTIQAILARVRDTLTGEPLRAIVYGAAVVVWLVTHIAVAMGYGAFRAISIDEALIVATAAAATLTEICRRYVYSPNTVAAIEAGAEVAS